MWVGGQRHTPVALPPGKRRFNHCKGLGGSQRCSEWVRKTSPPSGFDPGPSSPQRVAIPTEPRIEKKTDVHNQEAVPSVSFLSLLTDCHL